jgi:hypothetical protein
MIRALVAAAGGAPRGSGGVIYADDQAEKDVIVRVADATQEPLEPIHAARMDRDRFVARVASNGCTDGTSFAVEITAGDDGWTDVALRRERPDLCKALVPDGVELSWPVDQLGLEPGARVRVVNPTRL